MPVQTPTLETGDNQLIFGTARKTYPNNQTIIARLVLSEIIQGGLPMLGAIPAAYKLAPPRAKKTTLIAGLAAIIEIIFLEFPTPPVITPLVLASAIVKKIGAQEIIDAIENVSTVGIGPRPGNLLVFQNDPLGIPAGEYSKSSIWRSANQEYIVESTQEWLYAVDWMPGVPNLSWLGDWFEYDVIDRSVDEFSVRKGEFDLDFLDSTTDSNDTPPAGTTTETKKPNFLPVLLGSVGFLVGGPIGAGAGFLIGTTIGNK